MDQITAALNKPQSIKGKNGKGEIFKEWFHPFRKILIYENDLTIRFYFGDTCISLLRAQKHLINNDKDV